MQKERKEPLVIRPRSEIAVPVIMQFYAKYEAVIAVCFLALFIAIPAVANKRYITNVMIDCCRYSVLALSLNLLAGFMGMTSLGHAAFYGIGAYTAAIMSTRLGTPFLVNFLCAFLIAGAFGFIVGLPTLRIKGRYLPIITMGFCEIIRLVELNWMSFTRGAMGIGNIPTFFLFGIRLKEPMQRFAIALIMALLTLWVVHAIVNSRTGRAIMTIRDDETAAGFMGINVFYYKVLIFTISAALAGVAGAFYAHNTKFIDSTLFTFDESITILCMIILGGMGSIPGSIIGAIIFAILPELLRDYVQYRPIIYGFIIIIMVIVRPKGILGGYNAKYIRQKMRGFAGAQGKEAQHG